MSGTGQCCGKEERFRRVNLLLPAQLDLEDFPLENKLQGTEMHLDNAFTPSELKFWPRTSVLED